MWSGLSAQVWVEIAKTIDFSRSCSVGLGSFHVGTLYFKSETSFIVALHTKSEIILSDQNCMVLTHSVYRSEGLYRNKNLQCLFEYTDGSSTSPSRSLMSNQTYLVCFESSLFEDTLVSTAVRIIFVCITVWLLTSLFYCTSQEMYSDLRICMDREEPIPNTIGEIRTLCDLYLSSVRQWKRDTCCCTNNFWSHCICVQ